MTQGILQRAPRTRGLRRRESPAVRAGLTAFGVVELATGALMAIAPGTFFARIGPYGEPNAHYIRDMAAFEVALGAALLVAIVRPRWRVPVLALATIRYALHAVNHLVDVGAAEPTWLGPANLVLIAIGTMLLGALLAMAARDRITR